jgi:hypothetical protein
LLNAALVGIRSAALTAGTGPQQNPTALQHHTQAEAEDQRQKQQEQHHSHQAFILKPSKAILWYSHGVPHPCQYFSTFWDREQLWDASSLTDMTPTSNDFIIDSKNF